MEFGIGFPILNDSKISQGKISIVFSDHEASINARSRKVQYTVLPLYIESMFPN